MIKLAACAQVARAQLIKSLFEAGSMRFPGFLFRRTQPRFDSAFAIWYSWCDKLERGVLEHKHRILSTPSSLSSYSY